MRTRLRERIEHRACVVGIIGMGYVGLPLSVEVARAGHRAVGVDVNERIVATLKSGASHIPEVP
ncbi:MAG TPA: hypothetical protein VKB09_04720, partial [Thermomicrobiales bacterium]|nr:hypothetical protein [Thermomicrobiales bacterium]